MTDFKAPGSTRRWYDAIPSLSQAIHISQSLPPEIQEVIARCLNEAIDTHRKNRRAEQYAVSLGVGRTMGLYRASYRRRWYDPNPRTHRAFNLMSSVPDVYLEGLAERILKAAAHLDVQKKALPWYSDESMWAGEIQDILHEGRLTMRQQEDGIRLSYTKPRRRKL